MNISWITKTFSYVGRSFQGMGVRREAKGWSNSISEKILLFQKAGFLYKTKIVLKETCNIATFIILTLKVPSKFIFLDFLERPKFQIVIFFTNRTLKALSLLMFLWSFEQKSTRTENIWKVFLSAIAAASITTAAFTTKISNVNLC